MMETIWQYPKEVNVEIESRNQGQPCIKDIFTNT